MCRSSEISSILTPALAMFGVWLMCGLFMPRLVLADDTASSSQRPPEIGDCVIFREGGEGFILKAPTYWLKGAIAALSSERRVAGLCPKVGKQVSAYSRDDWAQVAAATPCVEREAEVREVPVLRVRVAVDSWETPWSHQHGTVGWLFRGQFLNIPLRRGEEIDMDATWLERCEPGK